MYLTLCDHTVLSLTGIRILSNEFIFQKIKKKVTTLTTLTTALHR